MKRLIVFDLDGVIYRGNEVLPSVVDTLAEIRRRDIMVRFLTNNSTKSRKSYSEKMRKMGINAQESEIVSSPYATAWYLRKHASKNTKVYMIGEDGLREELKDVCTIVDEEHYHLAEYVVVGLDMEFTYKKLSSAASAIHNGAKFIATNKDPTYPDSGGTTIPGGGAIVAAVETATGVKPLLIGKPEPLMMELLLDTAD
ncbi:MAG: HAD-IIA family hydrolase, partial [bacterium]